MTHGYSFSITFCYNVHRGLIKLTTKHVMQGFWNVYAMPEFQLGLLSTPRNSFLRVAWFATECFTATICNTTCHVTRAEIVGVPFQPGMKSGFHPREQVAGHTYRATHFFCRIRHHSRNERFSDHWAFLMSPFLNKWLLSICFRWGLQLIQQFSWRTAHLIPSNVSRWWR